MTVYGDAMCEGRRAGRSFVGAEHLLLAQASRESETGRRLRRAGLSPATIASAIDSLAGVPAAVAADLAAAESLGVDVDHVVAAELRAMRPVHRVLPLGWRRARRWCEQATPPIAGDAAAANESALWLALARWHLELDEHHLAEVLLRWSAGSILVAERSGADAGRLAELLAAAHPPRRRVRTGHVRRARSLAQAA
jgi:hypothetical protein